MTYGVDAKDVSMTVKAGETVNFASNTSASSGTQLLCYPKAPNGKNPSSGNVETTVGCWSDGGPITCKVTACPEVNHFSPTNGRCYDPDTNWHLDVDASCIHNVSALHYPITIKSGEGCLK